MKPVIIESPYACDVEGNRAYLDRCILDCLRRGEAPIASHRMYTSALDDLNPVERALGIAAGLAWYPVAERCVVYADRGVSRGMRYAVETVMRAGWCPVEARWLDEECGDTLVMNNLTWNRVINWSRFSAKS